MVVTCLYKEIKSKATKKNRLGQRHRQQHRAHVSQQHQSLRGGEIGAGGSQGGSGSHWARVGDVWILLILKCLFCVCFLDFNPRVLNQIQKKIQKDQVDINWSWCQLMRPRCHGPAFDLGTAFGTCNAARTWLILQSTAESSNWWKKKKHTIEIRRYSSKHLEIP